LKLNASFTKEFRYLDNIYWKKFYCVGYNSTGYVTSLDVLTN